MERTTNRSLTNLVCASLLLTPNLLSICPAVASAAVIGASGGAGPSTTSSFNKAGTGWFIDDGTFPAAFGRQDVAYDPSAGPWHKILAGGDGGDFTASDIDLPIGVVEYLTIAGTTPWTDWHERFRTLGWRWIDDRSGGSGEPSFTHSDGTPIPGLSIAFTDPTPTSGGQIDFKFDPLPPGTYLNISKRFVYDGLDPLLPGEVFIGRLNLFEYPTVSEPAGIPGDYNHDGRVDAADYVVWRKSIGTALGYDKWRAHFGEPGSSGAALHSADPLSAAVPEPTSVFLLILGAGITSRSRRRIALRMPITR